MNMSSKNSYVFTVEVRGEGNTPEEAWEDACVVLRETQWEEFAGDLPEWEVEVLPKKK
jgi:hypothetical protein